MSAPAFAIVYDVQQADAWQQAHCHRALWGRRYTDIQVLDDGRIALVFRSGGERWREWESVRSEWILGEGAA